MSMYLFKNLFITERLSDINVINYLSQYNLWFPKNILTPQNKQDKIIIFFENSFFNHNKLIEIPSIINKLDNYIGFIKMYMPEENIIIVFETNFNYKNIDVLTQNLKKFREYILEISKIYKYKNKNSNTLKKFFLYWNGVVLNKILKQLLIKTELLNSNDLYTNYYEFK